MPEIIVKKPFKFAHGGYQVEEFEPSKEPRETTDECADLAVAEGWAQRVKKAGPAKEEAAATAAPENADAAAQIETKAAD
jgi:hypothetical protein